MTYGIVYICTNLSNDKQYVGQTTSKDPEKYFKAHLKYATNKENSNRYFYRAIRKYGPDNFIFEIVGYALDKRALDLLEDYFILINGTMVPKGYNLRGGGHSGRFSEIMKQRASAVAKRRGITSETRAKMIVTMLKVLKSDSHREKMSVIMSKVNNEPEHRKRNSLAKRKNWQDPIFREKVLRAQNAGKAKPETRKINSEKRKQEWKDENHRAKMVASAKRRSLSPEGRKLLSDKGKWSGHKRYHATQGIVKLDCIFCQTGQ